MKTSAVQAAAVPLDGVARGEDPGQKQQEREVDADRRCPPLVPIFRDQDMEASYGLRDRRLKGNDPVGRLRGPARLRGTSDGGAVMAQKLTGRCPQGRARPSSAGWIAR